MRGSYIIFDGIEVCERKIRIHIAKNETLHIATKAIQETLQSCSGYWRPAKLVWVRQPDLKGSPFGSELHYATVKSSHAGIIVVPSTE